MKVSTMAQIVPMPAPQKRHRSNWLSQKEAAEYLGVSIASVCIKSKQDEDPIPCRRLGRKVQYDFDELQKWEERNTVSNY